MADERRLDGVVLTVDGSPLPAELYDVLTMVRVEESVHLPDAFTVRFDDAHFTLFDKGTFTIGSRLQIAFRAEQDLVTVTTGEVTVLSVEQGPAGRHELVVCGLDVTHRLARGPKTRSFVQMTDADIVARVADDYGFETDIDATGEVHDYVLQTSESDYAFLRRLAHGIGFDVWITDKTLHFKPQPRADVAPPSLRWGENLHKFKVRFSSADRCDEMTVRGWDPLGKQSVVGRATEGDLGTTAPAAAILTKAAANAFGHVRRFAGQFPVSTQSEADALAQSLMLKASGGEVVARGEVIGDPLLAAGAEVQIERVGEQLSGSYRLTTIEHVYGSGSPYVTRFVCGGKEAASLPDLVGGVLSEHRRSWGGLVVGVVTNSDDPERLGRVKVKFATLTDDDESAWARVATPGAGPQRGLQCIPEVGDEVFVGFELGDSRRPVVVGGLWNRADSPPDGQAVVNGEVRVRLWKSRNGHRLELRDESDGSMTLAMGDAASSLVLTQSKSTLTGEQALQLEGQDIEIRAQRKLTLRAPQIEIAGDTEVKVAAGTIRLN